MNDFIEYTQEEIYSHYKAWIYGEPCKREFEWNRYCDVRDGKPLGFNEEQARQRRLIYATPNYNPSAAREALRKHVVGI